MSARTRRTHVLVAVAVAFAALGAAYALGAASAPSPVIKGCVSKSTGALRVITHGRCRRGERALSWNRQGPAGVPGATGAQGPQGPAGAAGADGNDGAAATSLVAQVWSEGALNSGSPGVKVSRIGDGRYLVDFGRTISSCVAHATQGAFPILNGRQTMTGYAVGFATVVIGNPGSDFGYGYPGASSVLVETHQGSATTDSAFMVSVLC